LQDGVTWSSTKDKGIKKPLTNVYIVYPGEATVEDINEALNQGKNVLLAPGVYNFKETKVKNFTAYGVGVYSYFRDAIEGT
jgi:hypothetical protein